MLGDYAGGRFGRLSLSVLIALLGPLGCKKEERAPSLQENYFDCADIPEGRLPAWGDAFEETRCERVVVDETRPSSGPVMQVGRVTVPLGPGSSETIEIAVARILSNVETPRPDPIVYLDGGPGGPSLSSAPWLAPVIQTMSPDRDVILVDQRGVGRSSPSLQCTETQEDISEALDACFERLSEKTDLDEFDTVNNANDFDEIRRVLGYEEWNLLGISYGTRLGLTLMRDHPEGVRSAILDSVVPLHRDVLSEIGINGYRAIVAALDACAGDSACSLRYPDPLGQLSKLVAELNDEPALVGGYPLSGDFFLRFVFQLLYSPVSLGYVPKMIDDAAKGDFEIFEQLETQSSSGGGISFGMHLSLHCSEEVPFSSREDYELLDADIPEVFRPSLTGLEYHDWCDHWPVEMAPPSENEPVVSDIPALILAGEFDPITPAHFAEAAHEFLTNSSYFLVENESHGASFSQCGRQMAHEFFDDPEGAVDSSCLGRVPNIDFLSSGARGVRTRVEADEIEFATGDVSPEDIQRAAEDLIRRRR